MVLLKIGKQNNKMLHRAYRNKPLTDRQKQEKKQRSSIRYIVERTFGLLKTPRISQGKIP
jgi:IS5 family transposase